MSKWSYIKLVRAMTCISMLGLQNNFVQLLPSRSKVPFETFFQVG